MWWKIITAILLTVVVHLWIRQNNAIHALNHADDAFRTEVFDNIKKWNKISTDWQLIDDAVYAGIVASKLTGRKCGARQITDKRSCMGSFLYEVICDGVVVKVDRYEGLCDIKSGRLTKKSWIEARK